MAKCPKIMVELISAISCTDVDVRLAMCTARTCGTLPTRLVRGYALSRGSRRVFTTTGDFVDCSGTKKKKITLLFRLNFRIFLFFLCLPFVHGRLVGRLFRFSSSLCRSYINFKGPPCPPRLRPRILPSAFSAFDVSSSVSFAHCFPCKFSRLNACLWPGTANPCHERHTATRLIKRNSKFFITFYERKTNIYYRKQFVT